MPSLQAALGATGSIFLSLSALSVPNGAPASPEPVRADFSSVETVAGPGYCQALTIVDPDSIGVGALVVDELETIFVVSGNPNAGLVRQVGVSGPATFSSHALLGRSTTSASRPAIRGLAAGGAGGLLIAVENQVLDIGAKGERLGALPEQVAGPSMDAGTSGDGGPAKQARLAGVVAVATDDAHNLYVADRFPGSDNSIRIRFVNRGTTPAFFYPGTSEELMVAPGAIDTIVGVEDSPNADDGMPARQVSLHGESARLAAVGNKLYVALSGAAGQERPSHPQGAVQMVNLSGTAVTAHGVKVGPGAMATVAGGGIAGYAGDGGPARSASLSHVAGLDADRLGNLLLADRENHRIRRVDASGIISTFAGTGATGPSAGAFNGNGRPATQTRFNQPEDVKVRPGGDIYISDGRNGQVRFVDGSGIVHAASGSDMDLSSRCETSGDPGDPYEAGHDRPAPDLPSSVAVDGQGTVYFSLSQTARIMKSPAIGEVRGLAAPGAKERSSGVKRPGPLAAAVKAGLYVLDGGDNRIRFTNTGTEALRLHGVTVAPGATEAVGGDGKIGAGGDGGKALNAQLSARGSLTADSKGNLFIADTLNQRVRQVDPQGIITTVLAPVTGDEGCCRRPAGISADKAGNLYVVDSEPPRVWFVNRGPTPATLQGQSVAPGAMRVVAGTGKAGFSGDGGPAVNAELQRPSGIAVDSEGNFYVADPSEHTIRKVDAGGTISTVLGSGQPGFNGDRLPGRLTALNAPAAVAVDRCGNLFIADSANFRVRRLAVMGPCLAADATAAGHDVFGLPSVIALLAMAALSSATVLALRRRKANHRGAPFRGESG